MDTKEALFEYTQRIGDSSLILGHRLSEWCGHGPILEEDIALINISLDLIGQAKNMLEYSASIEGSDKTADDLAYKRDSRGFKNLLICEQPNGDFGDTLARQFLFDAFHCLFLEALTKSKDEALSGYAEKSLKEVTYHLKHSSEWIIRLGDGTEESHNRIQISIDNIWMFTGELFQMDDIDKHLVELGIVPDLSIIKNQWEAQVHQVLSKATIEVPSNNWAQTGGKQGIHSEYLGFILAEMQFLPRAYPDAKW